MICATHKFMPAHSKAMVLYTCVMFSFFQTAWASMDHPLSQFLYVTYNQTDFDRFGTVYNYNGFSAGYYKENITKNAHPESRSWPIAVNAFYQNFSWYYFVQFTHSVQG